MSWLHMLLPRQDNGGGGGNAGGPSGSNSGTDELLQLLSDPFAQQVSCHQSVRLSLFTY